VGVIRCGKRSVGAGGTDTESARGKMTKKIRRVGLRFVHRFR
jgi:hypothetical protein